MGDNRTPVMSTSNDAPSSPSTHTSITIQMLRELNNLDDILSLNGSNLTIPQVYAISHQLKPCVISISPAALENMKKNYLYLESKIQAGHVIYGVNTGFGGSADVRSSDVEEIQKSLIRHLNAGFGPVFSADVPRGVMLVRVNSLCRAMSGVRPDVVNLLKDMLNNDIIPVVPKRGSVSASGDLMPESYIAACMIGRTDAKVTMKGVEMTAEKALHQAKLKPVTLHGKDGLGIVNSASFASSLGACLLFDANVLALLTQVATAMSHEVLMGRLESFHSTIHTCMPHPGQVEVATNMRHLLQSSSMAITQPELTLKDRPGVLKQDRYALRTSAQWLGPVVETLQDAMRRVVIDLNSTNDNPIIDHDKDEILHGGNFQGTAVALAMDQTRQALQLCGKLLFAQMSEIVNSKLNQGLPPNLCGSDVNLDFGFKGMDTGMASYMSELDWLTHPVTNHVLSAELHNQAVNSLGLLSARQTEQALEVLQMMVANIFMAQAQAVDLRWLKGLVESELNHLFSQYKIEHIRLNSEDWPWWDFVFRPTYIAERVLDDVVNGIDHAKFVCQVTSTMNDIMNSMKQGSFIEETKAALGTGTQVMYSFIRNTLGIKFYHADRTLDRDLQKIYEAIRNQGTHQLLLTIFTHKDKANQDSIICT